VGGPAGAAAAGRRHGGQACAALEQPQRAESAPPHPAALPSHAVAAIVVTTKQPQAQIVICTGSSNCRAALERLVLCSYHLAMKALLPGELVLGLASHSAVALEASLFEPIPAFPSQKASWQRPKFPSFLAAVMPAPSAGNAKRDSGPSSALTSFLRRVGKAHATSASSTRRRKWWP
jgi:hypothetical protein